MTGPLRRTLPLLDRIASAITPALLQPYRVPQRPFALGTASTFFIRAGYVSRDDVVVAASDTTMMQTRTHTHTHTHTHTRDDGAVHSSALALAEALAHALGTSVPLSDCRLVTFADPTDELSRLRDLLRVAPAAVLTVPLRALTETGDDTGPPANPAHYREWSFPELQALVDAHGIDAAFGGVLPASADDQSATIGALVLVGAERDP
jgi:hypothetical protein